MVKGWKEAEKRLTIYLSHLGVPAVRRSRAMQGEAVEDIEWGPFSVEYKTRAKFPGYVTDWIKQAVANCVDRIPIVIWHRNNKRYKDDLVLIRLGDFVALISEYHRTLMALREEEYNV